MNNLNKKNNNLIVKKTGSYGNGVFASKSIFKGEVIRVFGGKKITLSDLVSSVVSGKESIDDPLQIGRRTYLDLDEFSRTFNHSCDPNAALRKSGELFAIKDIKEGEQITYDYSATIAPTEWKMNCKCGSKKCRGLIGDVLSIPKKQLDFYRSVGALQRYMIKLVSDIEKRGKYEMPRYEFLALQRLDKKKYNLTT